MVMESTNALSDDLSMLVTKMTTLAASIEGIRAYIVMGTGNPWVFL